MTFDDKMTAFANSMEGHLTAILNANAVPERLADAMRYATLGGGKRFRPFLTVETARLFGDYDAAALDAGAAVELIHCYSLAHDDLPAMDDDDLRRGRPTCHKAYDEATAILAGDALQTLAFDVLANSSAIPDPARRCELVRLLAHATGWAGMAGGQMFDLEAEQGGGQTLETVSRIQRMKTGALIRYAVEAGAVVGGAENADRARLVRYAEALGLAFQISDDLLDAEGDAATVGKATGKDAAAGKATFLSLLGAEGARKKLQALLQEADDALAPFSDRADTLKAAMNFMIERRS